MNWKDWLLWGFVATLALTTVMAGSQGLRLTRINLPYMLGAMFTPNRERAKLVGFVVHLLNGWIFSLVYVAVFHSGAGRPGGSARRSDWSRRSFVLTVG